MATSGSSSTGDKVSLLLVVAEVLVLGEGGVEAEERRLSL